MASPRTPPSESVATSEHELPPDEDEDEEDDDEEVEEEEDERGLLASPIVRVALSHATTVA